MIHRTSMSLSMLIAAVSSLDISTSQVTDIPTLMSLEDFNDLQENGLTYD